MAASPAGHTLQSWAWGALKARTGWETHALALVDGDRIAAAALVLIRPLPRGFGRLAYVPKGPVLDYSNQELVRTMMAALRAFAGEQRVISLKIEPEVTAPSAVAGLLCNLRLQPSPPVQMRSTIWVDLRPGEDEMLSAMKQKTRYNIRLAAKKGVRVSAGSVDDLNEWYDMYAATSARDGFSIHPQSYYRDVLDTLGPAGEAVLLLARHEGDLLAGIVVFRFGSGAQYMYGASSNEKRNLMAPYLVQWEGMRWARAAGADVYDLWGIPDVLEEQEDLWGVYRHKRGYGGEIVRYIGAFDLVRAPVQHLALEKVARPLFKRVARRRTRAAG